MKLVHVLYIGISAAIVGGSIGIYSAAVFAPAPFDYVDSISAQVVKKDLPELNTIKVSKNTSASILFLGDLMFDRNVAQRIKNASGTALYPLNLARGKDGEFFSSFDAVVANLEGPVTALRRPPVKSIDFAFATSIPALLKESGITAVSQANNHTLDQGREGAADSLAALQAAGLITFGDEVRDDMASARGNLFIQNVRIALLGFNATEGPIDREQAAKAIVESRATADHVIVYMHWGEEYQAKPSRAQIDLAHWFIDTGVDVVLGAHPHWVQSIEVYKKHPIAYSLGNFVFDQDFSLETKQGMGVSVQFASTSTVLGIYPAFIKASQPYFLSGEERRIRLEALAIISDSSLRDDIRSGRIQLTR